MSSREETFVSSDSLESDFVVEVVVPLGRSPLKLVKILLRNEWVE